jgi:DNA-binding transcriptional LysR family regulator
VPGVVDHDIDAAELLERGLDRAFDRGLIGDIERADARLFAPAGGERVQLLRPPRGRHHEIARPQGGEASSRPNPAEHPVMSQTRCFPVISLPWRPIEFSVQQRPAATATVRTCEGFVVTGAAKTPELRQLRYFVAVAEELSFTNAAGRVGIAQQSLSQQIKILERILGVRLFDRDTRGTRLTEVGKLFLPEARAVLDRTDHAVGAVRRASRGEVGELKLAFLSSTANYLLPPVLRAFRRRYPDVELTTEDVSISRLVAGVQAGWYDAGFTRPPLVEGFATRTLIIEQVCAVLPTGHPLAGQEQLRLADLADEPWVVTERSSWPPWHRKYHSDFREAGFEPKIVQRASSVQNLLGLVAAGVGVTRLAQSAHSLRRSGVEFVPLAGDNAQTEVVWLPQGTKPALQRLLEVVTELAATTDLTRAG